MDCNERLRELVLRFINHQGGAAEVTEDGALRVLLPPEVAEAVGVSEESVLGGTEIPLVYGSPVLERIIQQVTSHVPVVYALIQPPYLKKAGFEQILSRDISFPNARVMITGTAAARTSYMVLTVHYLALSDERREGHINIALQERTGANVQRLLDAWSGRAPVFLDPGKIPTHFPHQMDDPLKTAFELAKASSEEALQDFLESMKRRLHRDIRNIREYYATMETEMREGLSHSSLGEEQKEERMAKIADLPLEAGRKIEDIRQKYHVRIRLRPSVAIRILIDVVQVMVKLQYRKASREINLFWNPVTQAIDPLACEGCGKTISTAYCREEKGRIKVMCRLCNG